MSSTALKKKQPQPQPAPPERTFWGGTVKVAGGTALGLVLLGTSAIAGAVVGLTISFRNLPDVRVLRNYSPSETSYIYDIHGKLLTSIHGEANREVVPLTKISPELKRAVLAIEDSHFFYHIGINPTSIGRALWVNWRQGGVVEGGSTITMQLVKNLMLNQERTVSRKLAEAVLAIRVEQVFKKHEILELYLNSIYWGHNNYGVQTAAETYFNKPASQLTLAEAAMMAGLIQAPEAYSPFINYQETKRRQKLVLDRLQELGWISAQQAQDAYKQPLKISRPTAWRPRQVPYVTEAVIQELNQRFGTETVQKGGMRVQTTIDLNFQRQAEAIIQQAHRQLRGRGLANHQIALVAIDPRTHFVKAIVGGVDYKSSQYNRAVQSRRQPGSAFKPFVYYAAFATGKYDAGSYIEDSPVRYRDGDGYYEPKNYGGGYAGGMSLRTALIQSRNIPAVVLGQKVGLDKVIDVVRTLGIDSPLDPVVSLPLGAIGVTPLEMAGAYATFANNGWHSDPTVIVRVTDTRGNLLLDNTPEPKLVLDPWAAATLNGVLQGVIDEGTGRAAQIGRQAAGKTGTTSSERDVWFVGYVPQLAAAVWIGNDNYAPLGKGITGGGFAAPIWRDFMLKALNGEQVQYFTSATKFPRPKPKK